MRSGANAKAIRFIAILGVTIWGLVADGAVNQDAESLGRIGVDAFTRLDYDTAVEKLSQAKDGGASVDSELGEAKYYQLMWNGLQAEANGFKQKAIECFKTAAGLHPDKTGPKVALKRLTEGALEVTDVELSALDNNDERAIDFRQRAIAKLLKTLSARDLEMDVLNPADFDLGVGVDLLTGAARQKAVSGKPEESQILTERLQASEASGSSTIKVELDQTTQAALSAEYGAIGFGVHGGVENQTEASVQAAAMARRYTFRLWYEVITKKKTLQEPKCTLDSTVLLGEWMDNYGTHYVSEVLEGGWVQLLFTKECKNVEERQRLSETVQGAIGGHGIVLQGEVSEKHQGLQALQAVVAAQGLTLEARSAGATGTFDVSSISAFLEKRADFKKEGSSGNSVGRFS